MFKIIYLFFIFNLDVHFIKYKVLLSYPNYSKLNYIKIFNYNTNNKKFKILNINLFNEPYIQYKKSLFF